MGISPAEFVGHLHFLWWWAIDIATPEGHLPAKVTPKILAKVSQFPEKKSELWVNSLLNCGGDRAGFLEHGEDGYWLHDWFEYAGKLNVKRAKDRKRKQDERHLEFRQLSNGSPTEVQRTSERIPYPTVPTVPTEPTILPSIVPLIGGNGKTGAGSSTETEIKPSQTDDLDECIEPAGVCQYRVVTGDAVFYCRLLGGGTCPVNPRRHKRAEASDSGPPKLAEVALAGHEEVSHA